MWCTITQKSMSFRSFEFETPIETWYNTIAEHFQRLFNTSPKEDIYRVLGALYLLWKTTGKWYDNLLFSMALDGVTDNNQVHKHHFFEIMRRSEVEKNYFYDPEAEDQLLELIKREKAKGHTIGLKFGHYRRITLPQILELNAAYESCDFLILIIESVARTSEHKHKQIELTDQQRLDIFTNAGLANLVLLTGETDYSNEYYRQIVTTIQPDVLYASAGWSEEVLAEYQTRATLSGATLVTLPEDENYHTSMIEKFIF